MSSDLVVNLGLVCIHTQASKDILIMGYILLHFPHFSIEDEKRDVIDQFRSTVLV